MGVTTKTGDKGQTSLFTGERVDKDHRRVEVYGSVDSLASALGMARAFVVNESVKERILNLQKKLGMLMADFASIGKEPMITAEMMAELEADEDAIEKSLPPLRVFLIPGETKGGAMLDFARTTARTAERRAWSLRREEDVHEIDIRFLNRMSDYIFLLMRLEEQDVRDK
ncbi:cob(I)yrinic acid a,c-diamide adenosyltransferase [Selenomonas sp. F0473]|uniref:cob(I)yrinic acid a,c-diamide adenosyltransferase n=1 Tax=Selenomonas sp. F0473 TaxID=999423 RepID=UPI00029E2423|nr:cob(I)yrinic acid a,c-diamide adenosyltransferase [Selenomonas sp. F0473]EKU72214.1 ATP:cob(I)alamin adenosyltransferase [Selenomonas sp. F0473]